MYAAAPLIELPKFLSWLKHINDMLTTGCKEAASWSLQRNSWTRFSKLNTIGDPASRDPRKQWNITTHHACRLLSTKWHLPKEHVYWLRQWFWPSIWSLQGTGEKKKVFSLETSTNWGRKKYYQKSFFIDNYYNNSSLGHFVVLHLFPQKIITHRICHTRFRRSRGDNLLDRIWAQISAFLSRYQD